MWINHDHIAPGTGARAGRPDLPYNDVIAHEFGHIMDAEYAGDRASSQNLAGDAVEEAIADMFAYDYDRENATIGEDRAAVPAATGPTRTPSCATDSRTPTT